jgi:hypothetical protein
MDDNGLAVKFTKSNFSHSAPATCIMLGLQPTRDKQIYEMRMGFKKLEEK